jgi:hypothetical protein
MRKSNTDVYHHQHFSKYEVNFARTEGFTIQFSCTRYAVFISLNLHQVILSIVYSNDCFIIQSLWLPFYNKLD